MDVTDNESLFAAIKDHTCSYTFKPQRLKTLQAFHEVHGKSPGRLDFHRGEFALFPDEQVDFIAAGVAKEIDLGPYSLIKRGLD